MFLLYSFLFPNFSQILATQLNVSLKQTNRKIQTNSGGWGEEENINKTNSTHKPGVCFTLASYSCTCGPPSCVDFSIFFSQQVSVTNSFLVRGQLCVHFPSLVSLCRSHVCCSILCESACQPAVSGGCGYPCGHHHLCR